MPYRRSTELYREVRIPSHKQQVMAVMVTWANLRERFEEATLERHRQDINQAFKHIEESLH